ncbi:uncharacterized, partial [Lates japonicus]
MLNTPAAQRFTRSAAAAWTETLALTSQTKQVSPLGPRLQSPHTTKQFLETERPLGEFIETTGFTKGEGGGAESNSS